MMLWGAIIILITPTIIAVCALALIAASRDAPDQFSDDDEAVSLAEFFPVHGGVVNDS